MSLCFLLQTVSRHFRNIPVNEKETLTYFIYMVKSSKSRLDQKSDGSKQVEWSCGALFMTRRCYLALWFLSEYLLSLVMMCHTNKPPVYPERTWLKAWQRLNDFSLASHVLCCSHLFWGFVFHLSLLLSHCCISALYSFFLDCNVSFLAFFVWNNSSKYSSCGSILIFGLICVWMCHASAVKSGYISGYQ